MDNISRPPDQSQHQPPPSIAPRHVDVVTSRAISLDIAVESGLRSRTGRQMVEFGFRGNNARDGLHIPLYNTQGIIATDQLRPDVADDRKYIIPGGAKLPIYVPPASRPYLDNPTVPIVICESPLKALAVLSNAETGTVCPIAILGVWCWRTKANGRKIPLPEHKSIVWGVVDRDGRVRKRRCVYLVFDSDVLTNPMVALARWEYTDYLDSRGADVWWIDVPTTPDGDKQGIDDDLAASGNAQRRMAELVASAFRAPEEAPELAYAEPSADQETELERLRRENLQLTTENKRLAERNRALQLLILNPRLTLKQIQLGVSAITIAHAALSQTPSTSDDPSAKVLPDGRVQIKKAAIARDYRPIPAKGERRMDTNPIDGSKPLAARSSVTSTLQSLGECIDFEERTVRKQHPTTGDWYNDTEIVIRPSASQAEDLTKIASFDEYKKRKEYTSKPKQKECPHCGGHHEWTVVCTGCGTEVNPEKRQNRPVESISDNDDATEQVAEGAITKNVMASTDDAVSGSAPITYLSTKNVMPPDEPADSDRRGAESRHGPPPGFSREEILDDLWRGA